MGKSSTTWKKGQGGKPKGAISQKTKAWEELGDFLTQAGAEKCREILLNARPDDFIKYYSMFLEFFKPKQSRAEVNQNNTGVTEIKIIREGASYPPVISSTSRSSSDTDEPEKV